MGRLDGKVALISGGAGQGAAEAVLFAREGAAVIIGDVLDDDGAAIAAGLGDAATYRHLDVTDEASWTAVVGGATKRYGRVDVLLNNAGIFRIAPLTATDPALFHQVMAVNTTGVYLGMRAVVPGMIERRTGSIVNISSIAGLRGAGTGFAYGTSKSAVRGMTRAAAVELAPFHVRCNSVHPGIIDTPMAAEFDAAGVRDALAAAFPTAARRPPKKSPTWSSSGHPMTAATAPAVSSSSMAA